MHYVSPVRVRGEFRQHKTGSNVRSKSWEGRSPRRVHPQPPRSRRQEEPG